MPHALSDLEKSKLLNEFALMPVADVRRIKRATDRGVMLCDAHERDIQRARVSQAYWWRLVMGLLYIFMAINTFSDISDRSGVWLYVSWLAAIALVVGGVVFLGQWWMMRRLRKRLDATD